MSYGYENIKAMASRIGARIPDLLALARNNDPFFAGSEAQRKKAEWFLAIWLRFGFLTGVHLRRIHYRLVSQEQPVLRHDGEPYLNTEGCWSYLGDAGKMARYLGLVSPCAFEDHRNPPPRIYFEHEPEPTPALEFDGGGDWSLPWISTRLDWRLDLDLPQPIISGYGYRDCDQPYHLELWIEKSTMDDVIVPICRRHSVNIVPAVGFQSMTGAIDLLKRVSLYGKPARIFYISDFDPAGDAMPVAVSRQAEYWLERYAPGADIRLTPLALTREQVIEHRLPRTPIKETDRRRGNFEDRYGTGAVELDALESLYPGLLAQMLEDAFKPYRDPHLRHVLQATDAECQRTAKIDWRELIADEIEQLAAVRIGVEKICKPYQAELEAISQRLDEALAPYQEEIDAVWQAIQAKTAEFKPDLPPRPRSTLPPPDDSDWLFDSSRDYFTQLAAYKQRKAANDDERTA